MNPRPGCAWACLPILLSLGVLSVLTCRVGVINLEKVVPPSFPHVGPEGSHDPWSGGCLKSLVVPRTMVNPSSEDLSCSRLALWPTFIVSTLLLVLVFARLVVVCTTKGRRPSWMDPWGPLLCLYWRVIFFFVGISIVWMGLSWTQRKAH